MIYKNVICNRNISFVFVFVFEFASLPRELKTKVQTQVQIQIQTQKHLPWDDFFLTSYTITYDTKIQSPPLHRIRVQNQ